MPRTVQEILDHADELAARFEDYEPNPGDERDLETFAALRQAVVARSDAERAVKNAVYQARQHGYSWTFIGTLIGTSGEAARQRYRHQQDAWPLPAAHDKHLSPDDYRMRIVRH